MPAQRLAGVGPAHPVGAEDVERAVAGTNRAIWSGTAFMKSVTAVIGPGRRVEQLGDERHPRRSVGCRRFQRSTAERLLAEALVARRRPQLGGDVVVLGELGGGLAGGPCADPENRIVARFSGSGGPGAQR